MNYRNALNKIARVPYILPLIFLVGISSQSGRAEVYQTRLIGDGNKDCVVDIKDLNEFRHLVANGWYNPNFDFNKDDVLNIKDGTLIGRNYGKKCE